MSDNNGYTWRDHSRLFLACGVVILSPFQYGFDFGMIGGLQAMVGFLRVRRNWINFFVKIDDPLTVHTRSLDILPTSHL
jgi:hypothetical protein